MIAAVVVLAASARATVRADDTAPASSDAARADALFREGKARLAELDYARACPLLAQSVALDPGSGSLLALAICHEREGKLASAFADYTAAVERSQRDNRPERAQAAKQRIADLESKLSTLTLETDARAPGLELRVNGKVWPADQLGKPVAVDGGEQAIEATAPNKKPWQVRVTVADNREQKRVVVPALEGEASELSAPVKTTASHPSARTSGRARRSTESGLTATQWAGLGAIGGGLVVAAGGGLLMLHAVGKDEDSKNGCVENLCTVEARRDRLYARDAGNAATIAFITSGALIGAGLVLYIAGGQSSGESQHARALNAGVWAVPGSAGASLHGVF